jgi:hypothetical protein
MLRYTPPEAAKTSGWVRPASVSMATDSTVPGATRMASQHGCACAATLKMMNSMHVRMTIIEDHEIVKAEDTENPIGKSPTLAVSGVEP